MTQPENFTAAQASDPATPGQVLADIAALRPDLRAAVAGNPSAYPGLIEWLGSLGEPAVDAAIAARQAGPAATQVMPVQPPMPQAPQTPPAPQWAQQGQQPAFSGAPVGMPPQGMPPQGMAPQGMPPQGMPPQGGLQYGTPPAKSSNKALWIILIIVGIIALLGVGAFLIIKALADKTADVIDEGLDIIQPTDEPTDDPIDEPIDEPTDDPIDEPTVDPDVEGGNFGDDPVLDALWAACEAEDWQACDDLFMDSPLDSEYEAFGDTCGNRQEAGTGVLCVSTFGGGTTEEAFTYGDDPTLDALWDQCAAGDGSACDDLFWSAPVDSEYEDFGWTCGGTKPDGGVCE